jgi:cation transport ATPase
MDGGGNRVEKLNHWLYPELRQIVSSEQRDAMRKAKETPHDAVELIGLGVALLVTVALTRYSAAGWGLAERIGAMLANFVVAIPVLVVLAGPFYVRRTRRGLRTYLAQRSPNREA